jgi:hypothetical protein
LVLDRCGIEFDEKFARCPGCGEPKALICENGGIKCLHAALMWVPSIFPGFRSNVDIVAQCEGIAPSLAAEQILRWFGLDNAVRSLARPGEDSAGLLEAPTSAPRPTVRNAISGACTRHDPPRLG